MKKIPFRIHGDSATVLGIEMDADKRENQHLIKTKLEKLFFSSSFSKNTSRGLINS